MPGPLSSSSCSSTTMSSPFRHPIPFMLPTTKMEAGCYYYGLPSRPRLIARSSPHVWEKPTGPEAYLIPKELMPLGKHRLQEVWEDNIGPAMDRYLQEKEIQCTSMTPLRMITRGQVSESPAPAIVWIGVLPGSLSPELGLEAALHCRAILVENGVDDIHVEIYESKSIRAAGVPMYKPGSSYRDPAVVLRDPFSTTLGIPICNANTTNIEGTGAFFFVDAAKPGKLFLLTARHVLFDLDKEENKLYEFKEGGNQHPRSAMLLSEGAFKARVKAIKGEIYNQTFVLQSLERRLALANETKDDNEASEKRDARNALQHSLTREKEVMQAYEKLLDDISRDWQDESNRIIGHVVFSPPLSTNVGGDGYIDDWAVVEIHPDKVSRLNFIGNAISLDYLDFERWLKPEMKALRQFHYHCEGESRTLIGTISDQEMYKPWLSENTKLEDESATMVLKNGSTSSRTVGCLNTVRSFVRYHFEGKLGEMSRELAVLSHDYRDAGAFAEPGDSGSVVVDIEGRVCGMITGGAGDHESFNCSFVTSIDFLVKRLKDCGIEANIFPLPTDL